MAKFYSMGIREIQAGIAAKEFSAREVADAALEAPAQAGV